MRVVIADSLPASIQKLDRKWQDEVKKTVFDYQVDPDGKGLNFEHLTNTKDKAFHSIRVNDDIRIIIHRTKSTHVLCFAGHHQDAYRWAQKRRLDAHPETGAAQMVVIDERVEEVVKRVVKEVAEEPRVFAEYEDGYLLALGVPTEFLDAVKHARQSNVLDLLVLLPEEAAERLLDLAAGRPVARPMKVEVDPFEHPDAQRRFAVTATNEELRLALESGWEKWVVFLHPTQRQAVEKSHAGPAKVSGTAGTGKTVVALHRAAHLARQGSGSVLLTTFSSTLALRLAQHLELLLPSSDAARPNVSVVHLHKHARDLWVKYNRRNLKVLTDRKVLERHLHQADRDAGGTGFDAAFLRAEWENVVIPYGVTNWEQYRTVSRAGRGIPLGAKQRKALWAVFERARASLGASGLLSWDQVCHEVVALLERHPEERFAHVVADEVQDFGFADLSLLRALVPSARDDLFLCGDSGQRIYKHRSSWLSAGIDVRGRATRLKVNYRTTEQIRAFSARLLSEHVEDEDGAEEARETVSLLSGPDPEIVAFGSVEEEVDGVASFLRPMLEDGLRPRDIAIFGRTESVLSDRAQPALEAAGLEWARLRDDQALADGCAAVGTMHRAKGLEFKVVVVMGCEKGLMPLSVAFEGLVDPTDKEAARDQEKNLLYVACTRARERVLVTHSGKRSEFLPSDGT
ncbi:MAG: 3'-5' exonuclease [Sandaracinus sp.]